MCIFKETGPAFRRVIVVEQKWRYVQFAQCRAKEGPFISNVFEEAMCNLHIVFESMSYMISHIWYTPELISP